MQQRTTRDHELSPAETRRLVELLRRTVLGVKGMFTIGRSDSAYLDRLHLRYRGAQKVRPIWRQSPGRVATAERFLLRYAREHFPTRLANANVGGGGRGVSRLHWIYVVEWGDTLPTKPPSVG